MLKTLPTTKSAPKPYLVKWRNMAAGQTAIVRTNCAMHGDWVLKTDWESKKMIVFGAENGRCSHYVGLTFEALDYYEFELCDFDVQKIIQ